MLKIEPTQTPGVYSLKLEGAITEETDFSDELPADGKRLDVQCRAVSRINSMGITKWILFFRGVRKRDAQIRFFDVPVAVVNLCNFVSGMVEKGEVQSFNLPFFCDACNTDTELLRTAESFIGQLEDKNLTIAPIPCPNCQKPATFDGVPTNFLDFLKA